MKRDKFTCRKCGDTETQLHVHHIEYSESGNPWDVQNNKLITVCEDCHKEIEKVIKEHPDVPFNKIKIYKSDNWKGGSKIMFTSIPNRCSMVVYDDDGKWLCGYNLESDISKIISILKYTQRI